MALRPASPRQLMCRRSNGALLPLLTFEATPLVGSCQHRLSALGGGAGGAAFCSILRQVAEMLAGR
jgi:hypothetical protein